MSTDYTKTDWFDEEFRDFDLGNYTLERDQEYNDKGKLIHSGWGFGWEYGCMDVAPLIVSEPYALAAAKLFGYLWGKKVPCHVARDLARNHISTVWRIAERKLSEQSNKENDHESS